MLIPCVVCKGMFQEDHFFRVTSQVKHSADGEVTSSQACKLSVCSACVTKMVAGGWEFHDDGSIHITS